MSGVGGVIMCALLKHQPLAMGRYAVNSRVDTRSICAHRDDNVTNRRTCISAVTATDAKSLWQILS